MVKTTARDFLNFLEKVIDKNRVFRSKTELYCPRT